MTENVVQTGCPVFDDISAYLDGEADAATEAHIATCKSCQHVVASLQILDSAVGRACQTPAGLGDRILLACERDGEQASEAGVVPFWGRSIVRYAAAVVLTLGLAAAVRTTVVGSGGKENAGSAQVASVQTTNGQAGETLAPQPRSVVINDEQVAPVGVVSNQGSGTQAGTTAQHVIDRDVTHVWGTTNLASVKKDFAAQLPAGANYGILRRNDEDIAFQVKLTDAQLQKLVESMHAKGWVLFSPQLPQPGQKDKVQLNGSNIVYQAEFIPVKQQ